MASRVSVANPNVLWSAKNMRVECFESSAPCRYLLESVLMMQTSQNGLCQNHVMIWIQFFSGDDSGFFACRN